MKIFIGSISLILLAMPLLSAQNPAQEGYDPVQMETVLKEAEELQSTEPQSVAEKLDPLLSELRGLHLNAKLGEAGSRILKDTLLLMMRTQAMLLAPEEEILALVRELLILDPKIDESIFNPREKLLLEKIRSAETGSLEVETTPPGAALYYMGAEFGTTPAEIELIAGSYRFQLRLPDYLDQDIDVTVQPSETVSQSYSLRPRVVEVPIAINAPSTTIIFNGQNLGASRGYREWLASLPGEQRQEYDSVIKQWGIDPDTYSFFRLIDVPVGAAGKVEFQADCYQPLGIELEVKDADVDWAHPIFVVPELQKVQLAKDTGSIEVSSTPSGAEVWLDGNLQGETPLEAKEICSGVHRIQVLHNSGQYVREITVQRGRALGVRGQLKPALAFLGIYERDPQSDGWIMANADSKTVAESLALNCRAFSDPLIPLEDIQLLRDKGSLPIDRLLQKTASGDSDGLIKKISAAAGRSDLLLLGMHTEKGYLLKLYSTLHPIPDSIEIADLDESAIDFLVSQLNNTERILQRLQVPNPGLSVTDSPYGLAILNLSSAVTALKTALQPGLIVKSVDAKPMSFMDFQSYLRAKKPEQNVILEVLTGKEDVSLIPVPIRRSGAEYAWSMPDSFPNSVLTMLRHIVESDPLSEEAKYAALSLARGFMRTQEWKTALEYLAKTNLEPHKSGVCPGTVLYYQGRCYEEIGDHTQAENYYMRAKDYAEATLGMPHGLSVPILAEQRIEALKNSNR
jgi:tetratricopeptide (TPR) repeat protein